MLLEEGSRGRARSWESERVVIEEHWKVRKSSSDPRGWYGRTRPRTGRRQLVVGLSSSSRSTLRPKSAGGSHCLVGTDTRCGPCIEPGRAWRSGSMRCRATRRRELGPSLGRQGERAEEAGAIAAPDAAVSGFDCENNATSGTRRTGGRSAASARPNLKVDERSAAQGSRARHQSTAAGPERHRLNRTRERVLVRS